MNIAIRIILLTVLMAVALTMAVFTLAGFGRRAEQTSVPTGEIVLAAYDGSVAIFDGGDLSSPLEVTDIPLDALRASDRAMVEAGLPLDGREELAAVLEDLGS